MPSRGRHHRHHERNSSSLYHPQGPPGGVGVEADHDVAEFDRVAQLLLRKELELNEREARLMPASQPPAVEQLWTLQQQLQEIVTERQRLQREAVEWRALSDSRQLPAKPNLDAVLGQLYESLLAAESNEAASLHGRHHARAAQSPRGHPDEHRGRLCKACRQAGPRTKSHSHSPA
eukprot:EG_transcript_33016